MADLWWGLNSWNVYDFCGYTPGSPHCDYPHPNLYNAMDRNSCWIHSLDHVHWAIFDLGDVAMIKWLWGASTARFSTSGGDPWYVDVYVSNYDTLGDWILVASNINSWNDNYGCSGQQVNCADAIGRYILVEITECWWYWAYVDYLRWGTPNCSGYPPPSHHGYIFDVFGDWFTPTPIYLSGIVTCKTTVGEAELTGIAVPLSGTNECLLASWSELYGAAALLSGTNECMLATWSWLRDQFCTLTGTVTARSLITGELDVATAVHGSASGVSGTSGELEFVPFTELVAGIVGSGTSAFGVLTDGSVRLDGTIAIQSTVEGKLAAPVRLDGTINIQSSITGEITGLVIHLAGSITSTTNIWGKLSASKPITGTCSVQSWVGGEIDIEYTGPVPRYLTGTITIQSAVEGELAGMTREFAVTVAATSTTNGVMSLTKGLAGTIACSSSCTGDLTTRTLMSGTVTSSMLMSGSLKIVKRLIGVISSQSTTSAEMSLLDIIFLDGQVTASSNVAGYLKATWGLAATIAAESTSAGLLKTTRKCTGTISVQSTTGGLMERARNLTGAVTVVSTLVVPHLTIERTIIGTIIASSSVTGRLIKAGEFRVTVAVHSTVGGSLKIGKRFTGTITAVTTVNGIVHYRVPRFIIADALISPVLVCTIHVSSPLECAADNQPVLAHAVRASPIFEYDVGNQPVFIHSTRVNDKLELLTV